MPVIDRWQYRPHSTDPIGEFQVQNGRLLVVPDFRGYYDTTAYVVFREQPIEGWYNQAVRRGFKSGFLATALMPPLIAKSSMVRYFEEDTPRFIGVLSAGLPREPLKPMQFRRAVAAMAAWCDRVGIVGRSSVFVSLTPCYVEAYQKALDSLLDDRFVVYF